MSTLPFPRRPKASPADSARQLKRALSDAFPAVEFSVRLSRGTAYGNANVSWTDGPTVARVERITSTFEGEDFDGMIDLQYATPKVLPDGRESGIGLILTHRRVSPELAQRCAQQVATFYGVPVPRVVPTEGGYWTMADGHSARLDVAAEYWTNLIHRAASDHSRYARKTVAV